MPPLPTELDWSLFGGADVAPFKTMATAAREAYAARSHIHSQREPEHVHPGVVLDRAWCLQRAHELCVSVTVRLEMELGLPDEGQA